MHSAEWAHAQAVNILQSSQGPNSAAWVVWAAWEPRLLQTERPMRIGRVRLSEYDLLRWDFRFPFLRGLLRGLGRSSGVLRRTQTQFLRVDAVYAPPQKTPFYRRFLERETGLEPATLSLEDDPDGNERE